MDGRAGRSVGRNSGPTRMGSDVVVVVVVLGAGLTAVL